jgi:hypothetical protein
MSDPRSCFTVIRSVLEIAYFVSGIIIAVAALYGLKQISLTKKIWERNAKRENVKLAIETCRYFAHDAVPALTAEAQDYQRQRLTFSAVKRQFNIANGELTCPNFDAAFVAQQTRQFDSAIAYLNIIEGFAIPFTAGVADDEIGFRETAPSFCAGILLNLPVLMSIKLQQGVKFQSSLILFERWYRRLVAEAVASSLKQLQDIQKAMGGPNVQQPDTNL